MERNLSQELKVGLFVVFFLAVVAAAVYILGGSSDMFAEESVLHTRFSDVKGLKAGAVARLAGIDIGEVSRVEFSDEAGTKEIEVDLTIRSEYLPRLREDSVASISTMGVLGDMYVVLSVGSSDQPVVKDGGHIKSAQSPDILSYADRATALVENAANISRKVDLMIGSDEQASAARIAESLAHVERLLAEAKDGRGLIHTLVYDQEASARLKGILTNLEGVTADLEDFTHEVRYGEGLLHAAIYSDDGEKLAEKLGEAAESIGSLVTDVREGDSLAHALLYDPEKVRLVDDLQGAVTDLRGITAAVNRGEGTLGLLVRDPQLYEDFRYLLGGAQRNALLRAYVRSTVARGEKELGEGWIAPEPEAP